MEIFFTLKKDMFITIRDGLNTAREALSKMEGTLIHAKWNYGFIPQSIDLTVGKKLKEANEKARLKKNTSQTGNQMKEAVETLTIHHGKREKKPILSPVDTQLFQANEEEA